jgi:hypothetical protein
MPGVASRGVVTRPKNHAERAAGDSTALRFNNTTIKKPAVFIVDTIMRGRGD